MMPTRTELNRQLSNINRDISAANSQISVIQGQLTEINAAQTELRPIISTAANDRQRLDLLDCEDPHYWGGYYQGQCSTDYNESTVAMVSYTDRLDTWMEELNSAEAKAEASLEVQVRTLAGLNNSHRIVTNMLSNIR